MCQESGSLIELLIVLLGSIPKMAKMTFRSKHGRRKKLLAVLEKAWYAAAAVAAWIGSRTVQGHLVELQGLILGLFYEVGQTDRQ